jgi:hypothetical protein
MPRRRGTEKLEINPMSQGRPPHGREDAKRISGLQAARAADEFARREPVKCVSSGQEDGKEIVALTPAPVIGAKKGLPRLSKASSRDDAMVTPTIGLEEHKAALRQVFGETLSDEFVDVMLTKLVSVLRPGRLQVLDEATLNAAIALIASVQPRSELEAVIAVQIAATTFAGFKFLQSGQHHLEEAYIRIDGGCASRLVRLKLELIQALDKHRRDNKQTVRVEHVHIHAGAHAVLGIVNSSKEKDGGVEKEISGLHAASAADEFACREPVKCVSSPEEEGKQVVALTPAAAVGAKKAPPRLRKPSSYNDAVAPTIGLEEHKAALRQVFGETPSDEFVDVMFKQLVSLLRPGYLDVLDEATLNAAIALIASIQPRSELEAVITVEIAATAFASFKFLHLCLHHQQDTCIDVWGGNAIRLIKLELGLIQALDQHRRGNKQTVRVERVHLHAGAQGVLGIVNSSNQKNGGVEAEK